MSKEKRVSTTIGIDTDLCQGCGACVGACPRGAIHIEGGVAVIDQERCDACEACLASCPQGALYAVVEGRAEVVKAPSAEQMPVAIENRRSAVGASEQPRPSTAVTVARFLGREVLPRALGALLALWDSRQGRGTSLPGVQGGDSRLAPTGGAAGQRLGRRHRARRGGGRPARGGRRGRS